ncbi:MAG: fibro-slime domain-containing protein [Dehalococcoidia bacterium]|nr:fibro-slime domain-containing protein [Dehalococcoidia bacterium]
MRKLVLGALMLILMAVLAIPTVAAACEGEDCTPAPTGNDTITLTGTIRDFQYSGNNNNGVTGHSDFGVQPANGYGVRTGLVMNTLGVDGTPDLNPSYSNHWADAAIMSETSLKQWYSDNSFNQSMPYSMTFTEKSPGSELYVFSDTTFFPIDDILLGNEGFSHNYHFTLQLHTDFTYQQMQGRTLQFFSDDDLWVFIDGNLVVDLGGVHDAASASSALHSVNFDELGLSETGSHTFDLFFAERHTVDSQLCATAPTPELSTIILIAFGIFALGGLVWVARRKHAEVV